MRVPDRIVREPFPEGAMPRRLHPRLAWLDGLEWAIAVDACTTYAELRAEGWSAEQAAECAGGGMVMWLAGHLEHAVAVGLAFAQAADQEAA